MNKQDRAKLTKASQMIDEARALIEEIASDEREKFDNLSEGLQVSERGQKLEETADELDTMVEQLEEAMSTIGSIIS